MKQHFHYPVSTAVTQKYATLYIALADSKHKQEISPVADIRSATHVAPHTRKHWPHGKSTPKTKFRNVLDINYYSCNYLKMTV